MKNLRRANWIIAAITWGQAAFCGLSNLMAWESPWMVSAMFWPFVAGISVIISLSTLGAGLAEDDPAEKKACILCSLITIVITALFALLVFFVFGTWFGFGELSGEC